MHSIMKTNIGNELHFNLPPDRLGRDGFWGVLATIAALFFGACLRLHAYFHSGTV